MEYIAHRGESLDAPENTMAAFNLAWRRGCTAVETDIYLTADGYLICSHDFSTKRATGRDIHIPEASLSTLRELDAGRWRGEQWTGERLPLLTELFATLTPERTCYVEIKAHPGARFDQVAQALAKYIATSRVDPKCVSVLSFSADALIEARKHMPRCPSYYVLGSDEAARTESSDFWRATVETAQHLGVSGIDIEHRAVTNAASVQLVKQAGQRLLVWTVDDIDDARRVASLGVDGITSNRAAWLAKQMEP